MRASARYGGFDSLANSLEWQPLVVVQPSHIVGQDDPFAVKQVAAFSALFVQNGVRPHYGTLPFQSRPYFLRSLRQQGGIKLADGRNHRQQEFPLRCRAINSQVQKDRRDAGVPPCVHRILKVSPITKTAIELCEHDDISRLDSSIHQATGFASPQFLFVRKAVRSEGARVVHG